MIKEVKVMTNTTIIKRQNTKRDKYYMEYYTPSVKQLVLDRYRIDFETFGYDK